MNGADDKLPLPPEKSSQGGGPPAPPEELLEEFKDAVEDDDVTDQTGTGTEGAEGSGGSGVKDDAVDTSSGQAAAVGASVAQPPVAGRAESVIATGLANVRLPMGYGRRHGEAVDSDDEEQFHDALDSGAGMAKDAAKAKEMKEIGNE